MSIAIPFPRPAARFWRIVETSDGRWFGELAGPLNSRHVFTAIGDLADVIEVLERPEHRQGLPIIVVQRQNRSPHGVA